MIRLYSNETHHLILILNKELDTLDGGSTSFRDGLHIQFRKEGTMIVNA
jgi:hypothetical protein